MNREVMTRLYIGVFAIGAIALAAASVLLWPVEIGAGTVALFVVLVALIVVADHFSVIESRQSDVSLFTVPLYIAVLLMHPTVAAGVGAAGVLISQILARRPFRAIVFNVGMTALAGAIAGIVFFANRPFGEPLALTQGHVIAAILAGLVLHAHNILPVVGIITIRKGRGFWLFWAESYIMSSVVDGMLLSLGLITALVMTEAPWGLALMALPAIAAQVVLRRTVEYSAKKGMLAEELESRVRAELASWGGFVFPTSDEARETKPNPDSRRKSLRDMLR